MAEQKNIQTERRWTEAQKEAISVSYPSVLVSAAAGSGKTAVLTERILRRLTDEEHPADIGRLLIVTFTKAAAAELKQRISAALTAKMAENPGNMRLFRQYASLGRARISTIDSFCYELVRTHFDKLGLSPAVRLIDEKQDQLLCGEVMASVLEDYYANDADILPDERIPDFDRFSDHFSVLRDDRMLEAFQNLYRQVGVYPEGIEFLKNAAAQFSEAASLDFLRTPWGELAKGELLSFLRFFSAQTVEALAYLRQDEALLQKNGEAFAYQADFIAGIEKLLEAGSYAAVRERLGLYAPPRLGSVRADRMTPELERFRKMRSQFSDRLSELRIRYFSMTEEEVEKTASASAGVCDGLYRFLLRYDRRLTREKNRRGVLNYADLERLSYRLLYREDGTLTETAAEIGLKFDEIYIDEYQDVNELQDRIFTAIAGTSQRFMVGDIKQSIYAFRGAAPKLFADYRVSPSVHTVFLQSNFRCDRPVIDFCNTVFDFLFRHNEGRMPYGPEDSLVCGKGAASGTAPVEVAVLTGECDRERLSSPEADYVAERILKLRAEGFRWGDMAILLRSASSASAYYEKALKQRGIPYYSQISHDFFENAEVLLMLSLLNCIDNPQRDVHLAGLLKSPLFGFSLDDLIHIRTEGQAGSLFDSLRLYCGAHPDFEKGIRFLDRLAQYRKEAEAMPVDRLLWYLYQDTGILSIVYGGADTGESGEGQRANLMLLYEYARGFENGTFKGLYHFIRYLNEIIASGTKLETAKLSSEASDAVQIMTIHKSKGLEFPVCFVSETGQRLLHRDAGELLISDRVLGPAFRLTDRTGFAQIDSPFRRAVLRRIAEGSISEEMRILYVALTRAKERLVITGTVKQDAMALYEACGAAAGQSRGQEQSDYALTAQPDYLSWILTALQYADYRKYSLFIAGKEPDGKKACDPEQPAVPDSHGGAACQEALLAQGQTEAEDPPVHEQGAPEEYVRTAEQASDSALKKSDAEEERLYKALYARLSWRYPHEAASKIPAKIAVSGLRPSLLDEEDEQWGDSPDGKKEVPAMKKPAFLFPEPEGASAAERGTATHLFMQFCDFENAERSGVRAELQRLTEKQFLDPQSAALVQLNRLERFFASDLYRDMRQAKEIYREVRFNMKLRAEDFSEDPVLKEELVGEELLVQGVIDCFYRRADGSVILVDYKTDAIPKELQSAGEQDAFIRSRHERQLQYYRYAVRQLLACEASRACVYSFALGRTVEIPDLSKCPGKDAP